MNRCHETVTEVGVSLKGPEMIKFFSAFGFDVFRAGSLKLRTGAIIGVPRHFNYKSEYDIEKQDIVVGCILKDFCSLNALPQNAKLK